MKIYKNKYRIKKVAWFDTHYYIIEKKFLFWWNVEQELHVDLLGFAAEQDRRFATKSDAKKYIKQFLLK